MTQVERLATIKNIIFDIGNVLVRWDPRLLYRRVFADEVKAEWFLQNICTPKFNARIDAGLPYEKACSDLIQQYPEWEKEIRLYESGWADMFDGVIEENVGLLETLKEKGYPVYAISNWPGEKVEHARVLFPFFNWFNGMIISGVVKIRKPDLGIFQEFLRQFPVRPEESVFIDDLLVNCQAAETLGFRTHHYQSIEGLQNCLASFGVN